MRQAGNSEIIDLATFIRTGHALSGYKPREEQVVVIEKKDLVSGHYLWGSKENSQILCALNKTRKEGNRAVRVLKGYNPERPEIGDCIIGLRNHWRFFSESGEPFTNGIIGYILKYQTYDVWLPSKVGFRGKYKLMVADIKTEDGDIYRSVPIDYNCLVSGNKTLTDVQEMKLSRISREEWPWGVPFELDYGYFTSVWKAQGSEWDNVVLFEEQFPYDMLEHRQCLYTGITRASQKLVIVKK